MSQVSRTTAKTYFNTGDIPTETQFANMLDSVAFFNDAAYTALSGTDWDGSPKTKLLTGNLALTFSTTKRSGKLKVKQDATGGRTLTINGISMPISTGANDVSIVIFDFDDVASVHDFFVDTTYVGNVAFEGGGDVDPDLPALNAPGSLAAGTPTATHIPVTWTDTNTTPIENGYEIKLGLAADPYSSATLIDTTAPNANSYNVPCPSPSTAYKVWVTAKGDGTTCTDSTHASVTATTAAASGGDTDAQAFITYALGKGDTLSTTDRDALDQLFVDIKAAGIAMSDIIALYPSAGTTLAHKGRNAMYPFDDVAEATKHLVWLGTGSPTVAADGITPNGSDQKAVTNVSPATFPSNNIYIGYYSLTAAAGASGSARFDIGSLDSSAAWIAISCRHSGDVAYGIGLSSSSGLLSVANTDGSGYYGVGVNPTGPVNFLTKDGAVIDTDTAAGFLPSSSIVIGCGGNAEFSARKFGPVIIAKNITPTKDAALSAAFHVFMTTRGF